MAERDRFEFDLAAALRAYLEDAPTKVRPTELARQLATAYPHRRSALGRWGFGLTPAMVWVLLLAGLLLALLVGGLVAGFWRPDQAVVVAPQTTPTPATSTSPWGTPAPAGSMTTARVWHTAPGAPFRFPVGGMGRSGSIAARRKPQMPPRARVTLAHTGQPGRTVTWGRDERICADTIRVKVRSSIAESAAQAP